MFICFPKKKKKVHYLFIYFYIGCRPCGLLLVFLCIGEDASTIQVLKQPHINSVYTRALNRIQKIIDSFIFSICISNFVLISKYFLVFKQIKQTLYKSKLNYLPPKGQKKIKIQECFCIEKAY